MDKMTHEIRAASWRSIISQCQARPAGQTRKQWLAQNGISEKSYYYWQRKLRREAYKLLPPAQEESASPVQESPFVEVPFPVRQSEHGDFAPSVLIKTGKLVFEISNTVSEKLLGHILETVSHAG